MRKVIDYTILRSPNPRKLAVDVNEHLQSGLWELFGTPYAVVSGPSGEHFQALVEYEVEE